MKRTFCVILATVVFALSLCSCALFDAVTAYGLYSKAMKTFKEAGGFEADCVVSLSMNVLGQEVLTSYGVNVKQNGSNVKMTMDSEGLVTETTMIDRTVYVNAVGQKLKYTISSDKTLTMDLNRIMPELKENVFEGIDVIRNDDGTKAVSVELEQEVVKKIFSTLIEEEDTGISEAMSFENILFTMNFSKDNELESVALDCDMIVDILGMNLTSHVTIEYTLINFGTAPKVAAPEDADSYIDAGEYVGGLL